LFKDMEDAQILDAVCVRLKPVLRTTGSVIVREGDAVGEMLFIIRGRLDSVTTNGGRSGFFNQAKLGPGSFCGEELLTWVLGPEERSLAQLPASTRTIVAESEVEAFVLTADDVRHIARRFQRLHGHDLKHRFRVHSLQWQTWAACVIQAAWKRFKARRSLGLDASASASASAFDSDSASASASAPIKRPEEPDFGADAPAEPLPPLIDI
jgi:cyclic nucleotide gated channel